MNKLALVFICLLFLIGSTESAAVQPEKQNISAESSTIRVALVCVSPDAEVNAAAALVKSYKNVTGTVLTFTEFLNTAAPENQFDVIWLHRVDSSALSGDELNTEVIAKLKKFAESGKSILLTLDALRFLQPLELEATEPGVSWVSAIDEGFGRRLGVHAFKSHPVFDGLNGGSFIWAPKVDQINRQMGFFEDRIPNGKTIGVDWAYITLKDKSKLLVEYTLGKGKVLAVGAYTYYAPANFNRLHLETFTENCIHYLSGEVSETPARYWDYTKPEVVLSDPKSDPISFPEAGQWGLHEQSLTLRSQFATTDWWDISGERMLIMGKEKAGIDEIWTHPFMAVRDYEVGVRFEYRDSIYWFKDQRPEVEVKPEALTRIYQFPRAFIREVISADQKNPSAVIHYEYRGVYGAELIIKFKSNLRFMWPYSQTALGSLFTGYDKNLQAVRVYDKSGEFQVLVGANKKPLRTFMGQYNDFVKKDSLLEGVATDKLQVGAALVYKIDMNDNMDLVITGTDQGEKEAVTEYTKAMQNREKIFEASGSYFGMIFENKVKLTSPDPEFNTAYKWAVIGADKFFVNTPDIGSSFVAGYSTTARGWDGAQPVSGRPGYAWYFGRDAAWSGMAVLGYGDFARVKSILEVMQKYQDVSGKIYHELTTSGAVHYDASDATPLYIILAGQYLRWSGDTAFIAQSWDHIKHAMDFLYSTDTDGDHLIENTNVGHGWVEGGELYGGHTTVYLASCWSEALRYGSEFAEILGQKKLSVSYKKDSEQVLEIINTDFWNKDLQFLYDSKMPDGTFSKEPTVQVSVPMYFNQLPSDRAKLMLDAFASPYFSPDWGVRIVSEASPLFSPYGYHYGSVWPLFTGWSSLAEYKYDKPVQGFSHVISSLLIYKTFAKGYIEEVLNGAIFEPTGVCPHQCWSQTMALQPLYEGMLGLKPDALHNTLTIAPKLPADWDTFSAENIRLADHVLNVFMKRIDGKVTYSFEQSGSSPLQIQFNPYLPAGTEVSKVLLNGAEIPFTREQYSENVGIVCEVNVSKTASLEIVYAGGISVLPIIPHLLPHQPSEAWRIITSSFTGNIYDVTVESAPGTTMRFNVWSEKEISLSDPAVSLTKTGGHVYEVVVNFPTSSDRYISKTIQFTAK